VQRCHVVNGGLFAVFFGLHIVFASLDLELAFRLIALLITGQILLFGPVSVLLEGSSSRLQRRTTNQIGALLSLPLCVGLAWAYAGMAWSWPLVVLLSGASLGLHLMLDRRLATSANGPSWVG